MALRTFALVLALELAATSVLGVVCEMDCDPPATPAGCHESSTAPDESAVSGARHGCDHDYAAGSPALLGRSSARDDAATFIDLSAATTIRASVDDARVAAAAVHRPPGLSGSRTPVRTTVLRI